MCVFFFFSPCSGEKPAMKRAQDEEEADEREEEAERSFHLHQVTPRKW